MPITASGEVRGLAKEQERLAMIDQASIASGSPSEAVHGLIDEARATLRSEAALAKTAAKVVGSAAGRIALWGAVAAVLAFIGLLAGTAAAILALATVIGPILASVTVALILIVAAAVSAWRARVNVVRVQQAVSMVTE